LANKLRLLRLVTFAVLGTVGAHARAQTSPEPNNVNGVRGTISGSTRFIGLGGAFVSIADDSEGVAINPASVAVRLPYSWQSFDYGLGIDFAIGSWLPKNDIYNQPQAEGESKSSLLFGSIAAVLNYRHLGFGISAEAERNAASRPDQRQGVGTNLAANFGIVHAAVAYGFLDGQLQLGVGPRLVGLSFDRSSESSAPLTAGIGYETGVVVKPTGKQYRFGAAFKSPIDAKLPGDATTPEGTMHLPWQAALGFAYQFGPRKLNPSFVTVSDRARRNAVTGEPTKADEQRADLELYDEYQKRQRWYLLISSELSLIEGGGRVGLSDKLAKSRPIISPRLGVESEVVPHHLRLRAGSYYEPALTADASARVHGTGGLDVKLFEWSIFGLIQPFDYWQLSLAADAARSYLNTSFSIGFWH
jgi:hypothetical protein